MPAPQAMISAWEGVLERAAVEGITVNFATGDYGDATPLQYPGSDPWITCVGGTSLAVGAHGRNLFGYTVPAGHHKFTYVNNINGGTSLASPMFTGFEADLIQGRRGFALGFANPELYDMAGTSAFHDVTSAPQGQGVTEATVYGPAYQMAPTLATMGQCSSTKALTCGPGYDTVSGLGSPGPAFFRSFGSRPE